MKLEFNIEIDQRIIFQLLRPIKTVHMLIFLILVDDVNLFNMSNIAFELQI